MSNGTVVADRPSLLVKQAKVDLTGEEGEFVAKVATIGEADKDGDVFLPGSFGTQRVRVTWAHDWKEIIGAGEITEDDGVVLARGRFFLTTLAGRERYETVKALGDLQEWSYGFRVLDGADIRRDDGQVFYGPSDDGPALEVWEVSPVLVGAGYGTGTVALKDGMRFADEVEATVAALRGTVERAQDIAALRAEKDQRVGAEAVARLTALRDEAEVMIRSLAGIIDPHTGPDRPGVDRQALLAEHLLITSQEMIP